MENENSLSKSRDKLREKRKHLMPITIKNEQKIEGVMVKTENGVLIESDSILERSGIILNNSQSQLSRSDIEADGNDMNYRGNYSINSRMSNLQEDTQNKFNSLSLSEDQDGFKKPATKNPNANYVINNKSYTKQNVPIVKGGKNLQPQQGLAIENPNSVTSLHTTGTYGQKAQYNQNGDSDDDEPKLTLQMNDFVGEEEKEQDDIKLEDIQKGKLLGSGAQGHVYIAKHTITGMPIALKEVGLNTDDNFLKALKLELNTLRQCNSDYVVKCFGAYSSGGKISIALEYMDKGTLADVLKKTKDGTISEPIIGMITYQVLKGFEYLHKVMKVIHRDIKPSNLLINSQGQVKIADFGVSGKIENTLSYRETWVGTVTYMSPERCKGEKYNYDTDIWSLGLTILECALGRYPYFEPGRDYKNIQYFDLLEMISKSPVPDLPKDKFSDNIRDFVAICLRKEVGTRSSAAELLRHPFVKKYAAISRSSFIKWLETV